MTKRIFVQTVLAILLLLAQQIALTHALTHVHGTTPEQQEPAKGFLKGSCNLHGVYVQVLGGVPPSAISHAVESFPVEQVDAASSPRVRAPALAPPSRGPPVLL